MKTAIKSITIEQPCSELWDKMTPNGNGRQCLHCDKVVIDFEHMTDAAIISYFQTSKNICGRFTSDQLPRINRSLQPQYPSLFWKKLGLVASIASLLSIIRADAQQKSQVDTYYARHSNTQKNASKHKARVNSLYAREITADKIVIDTKATIKEVKNSDLLNQYQPITGTLGGVTVGIPIKIRSRWDSFVSRLTLFRY